MLTTLQPKQSTLACPLAVVTPEVVQRDAVGRLIVAQADVVVQLSELLAQGDQLILGCVQRRLGLTGC